MRRGLATVVMLGLVGLGAAACGSDGDGAAVDPSGAAASAPVDDVEVTTVAACDAAIADSEARRKEVDDSLAKLATAGGAEAAPVEKAVDDTMTWWAYQLTVLAAKDIDSDVRTVLTEAAATIEKLNTPSLAQNVSALDSIPTKIKNVCA
ncbi:hypothetical protein O7635_28855 [Asanoa sp. WMMD1127]|uniref:hypothetical protein n=1 Tax=Asanoa sp. WMMD1127 TaxID=3016107 RepID=UPI002417392E|nr:hypothetical protein [Asanoa sp. WMMD1127]MDG4825876.1 hypothetical protein [Asanoa sp. WMMD1127]